MLLLFVKLVRELYMLLRAIRRMYKCCKATVQEKGRQVKSRRATMG
jgi:hypothetical protein